MCLRFVFLLITRLAAWLRLSRREEMSKTAEILIMRHQLAVLQRRQPRCPKLTWADRALLVALLSVIPKARRHGLRLLVTPDTILRWHRGIVRRRWARPAAGRRSGPRSSRSQRSGSRSQRSGRTNQDPAATRHRRWPAPYVWVDVRADDATGTLVNLVIGNSGPTVATNLRVRIDPPLPTIDQLRDRAETAQARLADGIQSTAPAAP